ncbi:2-amino-thiazoline-4-carboxylic acid hydrolase [Roseospira marina]|uniref:2-amino-thiazoline-4-carboxylic acid hydrolase n=1 Tax=Roseospira marina TaxID=140057 RepID=A0A5M6IGN2_9PROT|nr:L-2-amino-thiazoline-4-carboxylic acid hydrolase [Roseospira marina]KAA5607471.1 2-amino-thiazoline-4-carboxylic acid hydrolase [Roseospira marina]MBB4312349.1 hypothetical protein [Roseospira marina]MBB5085635.1 hypothetical protein [Roseospira marina]
MTTDLPNVERRRIQGEVIKPIYDELVAEIGPERARALLARAITRSAEAEAQRAAQATPPGADPMGAFTAIFDRTYRDRGIESGLEATVRDEGPDRLDFDVTRCRFVEMYAELGLGAVADVLSCNRDGTFAQAYDGRLALDRAQTIAGGASCCTFRYRLRSSSGDGTTER